jgi:hypothetical protein
MYLLGALFVLALGLYFSPGDVSELPFAQLTLKKLAGAVLSWGCYIYAIVLSFKSLGEDRIWPWRWTLPYFGNLVFKAGLSAFFIWGAYSFAEKVEKKQWEWGGWLVIAVGVGVLFLVVIVLISDEFEVFKEKPSK